MLCLVDENVWKFTILVDISCRFRKTNTDFPDLETLVQNTQTRRPSREPRRSARRSRRKSIRAPVSVGQAEFKLEAALTILRS